MQQLHILFICTKTAITFSHAEVIAFLHTQTVDPLCINHQSIPPPGSREAIAFSLAKVIAFSCTQTVDLLCINHQSASP